MFWNKKKKDNSEAEQDIYDYEGELSDEADETDGINSEKTESIRKTADLDEDETDVFDAENAEEFDAEEYFKNEELSNDLENVDKDEMTSVTVTEKVSSLNSLAEFVVQRHPLNLQFMKKESYEVFELREAHLRIARVWGTVSMSRECSAEEYAKVMLAIELLENPESFYVLPALTENDLREAMADFCEEKYGEKSRKAANNPKKFARLVEGNGDKEEWKLFAKELLFEKTEAFCKENGIVFRESNEEEKNA